MAYSFKLRKKVSEDQFKTVRFYMHTATRKVYAQPEFLSMLGTFYWPVAIFDIDDTPKIYKFCIDSFEKMQVNNKEGTTEIIDLIKIANVKTYGGAIRKFEAFSLNWNAWEAYFFCKGERGLLGFTTYRETLIGAEINEDLFTKAYQKRMKKILRKMELKAVKKSKIKNI